LPGAHTDSVVQILLQVITKSEYCSPPRNLFWRADGANRERDWELEAFYFVNFDQKDFLMHFSSGLKIYSGQSRNPRITHLS